MIRQVIAFDAKAAAIADAPTSAVRAKFVADDDGCDPDYVVLLVEGGVEIHIPKSVLWQATNLTEWR